MKKMILFLVVSALALARVNGGETQEQRIQQLEDAIHQLQQQNQTLQQRVQELKQKTAPPATWQCNPKAHSRR